MLKKRIGVTTTCLVLSVSAMLHLRIATNIM